MLTKLPDYLNSIVIQQWLEGVQREVTAANNGLSAVAVTNTINVLVNRLNEIIDLQ
jgi:CheY-like chemotaxis protein